MKKPLLMGILNVTPDSFSDGGAFSSVDAAVEAGLRMAGDGADMIDVGGESTRPGSQPVSTHVELGRVLPVVERLARAGVAVSVDTSKATVADACLRAGAVFINDVTALSDPDMGKVCARAGCDLCLMHMQGTPQTMQKNPAYDKVAEEVRDELLLKAAKARNEGVAQGKIWIDPGIGFGKTDSHNFALLNALPYFVSTGYPVLIGVSRKGFIGRALATAGQAAPVGERLEGTLALQIFAQLQGVAAIRAHDVGEARKAIDVIAALNAVDI